MVDDSDGIPQGDKAVWCRIFEKSPEFSALVIDHAGPVAVLDSKLNVVYRNKSLEDILQIQQLPAARRFSLGCEECEAAFNGAVQEALAGKSVELHKLCAKPPAGPAVHLAARLIGLKSRAGSRFAVAFITDNTRLTSAMERIAALDEFAQIGLVMPAVGHQMNNSLAVVLGFSKLLLANNLVESVKTDVQAIHDAALRCRQLTDKFFRFASERCRPAEVDANHLIMNVVGLVARDMGQRGVHCQLQLDPSLPRIRVAAPFVEQALLNVINRASLAMPAGGTVVIESRHGSVADELDGPGCAAPQGPPACVEVLVTDSAGGIPASDVSGLFEPFAATGSRGRQIGLIGFAQMLLKQQRGDLLLHRTAREGTTFILRLPVAEERVPEQPPAQPQARPMNASKVILVVDDDDMCRMMLAEALARDGHFVDTAADGPAALAKIGTSPYDIIIVDVRMPEMDGPALYAEIGRRHPQLAPKVLFMTGDSTSGGTQEFLAGLPNPFLVKPFAIEELLLAVKNMC